MDARITSLNDEDMYAAAMVRRISLKHRLPSLPDLHSAEEDEDYWRSFLRDGDTVLGARMEELLVGVIAYGGGWIHQFYVLPDFQGQGVGRALLARAAEKMSEIRLWTFQRNLAARGFYEHHGFRAIELTDGRGNEEQEPDILYLRQVRSSPDDPNDPAGRARHPSK